MQTKPLTTQTAQSYRSASVIDLELKTCENNVRIL